DRVLNIIADYPTATKKDIAAELGLSVATVSNVLAALKLAGRIERVGSNKTGSWKIIR
ncbi:MAG: MarR family transcriptional regulator, partial [Candidatus Methanomethylophilus sp.]|nr:MarR family transcriptional regulator [Methanomethylophilus sp.]